MANESVYEEVGAGGAGDTVAEATGMAGEGARGEVRSMARDEAHDGVSDQARDEAHDGVSDQARNEASEAVGEGAAGEADGEAGNGQGLAAEGRFNLVEARRSFEAMRPELEGLDESAIVILRVDPQRAAATVLVIGLRDTTAARRAVFEYFAQQGVYDLTLLDRLPALAQTTWYLRRQQEMAVYDASGAALPAPVVAAAYETRGRMMIVLDYWLGDRPDISKRLAQLREGSGHQDLANDLETLAELYQRDDVRPFIEQDRKNYRATDVADAERSAHRLMLSLGPDEEGDARRLTGLAQRAATLMVRAYEEHCECARFFFRKSENVAVTYPSLVAAARNPRRKRVVETPVGGEEPGEAPGGDASEEAPFDGA